MQPPDVLPAETAQENRRGWSNCFPKDKTEDWHADFSGVTTLQDGTKCWVNVFKRLDKNKQRYVSVHVQPWKPKPKVTNG
jgi:hypothetical protein